MRGPPTRAASCPPWSRSPVLLHPQADLAKDLFPMTQLSGCGLRATATDGPGAAQGRRMVGNRLPEIVHVWDCTLLHDVIVHGADLRRGLGMLYQRHCRRLAASSSSSSRAGGGSRAKCAKPTSGWCGSRRTEASCAPHCAHGAARRQRQQQQPDLAAYWTADGGSFFRTADFLIPWWYI